MASQVTFWIRTANHYVFLRYVSSRKEPYNPASFTCRSVEEEREVFMRLFERFVDPREALAGEVPIPPDFNLGDYFIVIR